jgi:hypothetical protein
VSAPDQHAPPVYAVAAGAVLHAHAADTLEPAVLLHTFLPPGTGDALSAPDARVDVSSDGPASGTVTVRVLAGGASLSWQLPVAPFVAALPGQPGDEGRMVLLAVVDAEPAPSFWAVPADCEDLAAELQLPVADLVEALQGRLTPWLADDLAGLLHDDEHDRAVDRSPAQTLASAVLAHYRGDLDASSATTRLVRAIELAPEEYSVELGALLCGALVQALTTTSPEHRAAVLSATGPFETEALRLLTELPELLERTAPTARTDATMQFLVAGADREEVVRAGVSTVARLAREGLGTGLEDERVLQHLGMLDDAGLARLARLWVDLAAAVSSPGDDERVLARVAAGVLAEGAPGATWLRATAVVLAGTAVELAGRRTDAVAGPVEVVRRMVEAETAVDEAVAREGLRACLALARYVRQRGRVGARPLAAGAGHLGGHRDHVGARRGPGPRRRRRPARRAARGRRRGPGPARRLRLRHLAAAGRGRPPRRRGAAPTAGRRAAAVGGRRAPRRAVAARGAAARGARARPRRARPAPAAAGRRGRRPRPGGCARGPHRRPAGRPGLPRRAGGVVRRRGGAAARGAAGPGAADRAGRARPAAHAGRRLSAARPPGARRLRALAAGTRRARGRQRARRREVRR